MVTYVEDKTRGSEGTQSVSVCEHFIDGTPYAMKVARAVWSYTKT